MPWATAVAAWVPVPVRAARGPEGVEVAVVEGAAVEGAGEAVVERAEGAEAGPVRARR